MALFKERKHGLLEICHLVVSLAGISFNVNFRDLGVNFYNGRTE